MATVTGLGPLDRSALIKMDGVVYHLPKGSIAELTITEAKPKEVDIARLRVDREYWDSVAPESATHYGPRFTRNPEDLAYKQKEYVGGFYRLARGWWQWRDLETGEWRERFQCIPGDDFEEMRDKLIPRPPEDREVEWSGEGLPPVGCECEAFHHEEWRKCEVLAHKKSEFHEFVVYWTDEHYKTVGHSISKWFRPIKTKEQREREDLANIIDQVLYSSGWEPDSEDSDIIAAAVIAEGYRRR